MAADERARMPWEWRFEDLDRLRQDGVPESLLLEYKRSNALGTSSDQRAELCKDASALANSDGGTLVYGVIEDGDRRPKEFDDGVNRSQITPEWIGQVLESGVRPRIDVCVGDVALPGVTGVAYVVHIEKGRTAHMAGGRYYKRVDCRAVPMEDYEVRDVMGRANASDIRVTLEVAHLGGQLYRIRPALQNLADVPALYFSLRLYLLEPARMRASGSFMGNERVDIELDGSQRSKALVMSYHWITPARIPLFKGLRETISDIEVDDLPDFRLFPWEVVAPGRVTGGLYAFSQQRNEAFPDTVHTWRVVE